MLFLSPLICLNIVKFGFHQSDEFYRLAPSMNLMGTRFNIHLQSSSPNHMSLPLCRKRCKTSFYTQ